MSNRSCKLRICVSTVSNCIVCNRSNVKLRAVPSNIIDEALFNFDIIIKCSYKLCGNCFCNHHSSNLYDKLNLEHYNPLRHSLSNKWLSRLTQNWRKNQLINQQNQTTIKQNESTIKHLQKEKESHCYHKKWSNTIPIDAEYDYDEERRNIPKQKKSNCWNNSLNHELMAEYDCYIFTGWNRTHIIDQAEIAQIPTLYAFQVRHFIYKYPAREIQARTFGMSPERLNNILVSGIKVMDARYAKPLLVNGKSIWEQFWTRKEIHKNIPDFVFKIRTIDPKSGINILTTDGTYQFCQENGTDLEIRKKQMNMHKKRPLYKIHIWACPNAKVVYVQFLYGDGYHADGRAFAAVLNKKHLKECEEAIENGCVDETKHSFTNMEVIQEIKNLQKLLDINDEIICDNGYRLRLGHPMLKMPNDAPYIDDGQDGQITVLAAAHKRGIMAIRNGHERLNGWCKRNAFCKAKIRQCDVPLVPPIWRIVLSDVNRYGITITKDNTNNALLTERILDMMYVSTNPMDIYWEDKNYVPPRNTTPNLQSNINLKHVKSNFMKNLVVTIKKKKYCRVCNAPYTSKTWQNHKMLEIHKKGYNKLLNINDNQQDIDDDKKENDMDIDIEIGNGNNQPTATMMMEKDDDKEEDNLLSHEDIDSDHEYIVSDDPKNWIPVAVGWPQIANHIQTDPRFVEVWGKPGEQKIQRLDVDNYLGKDWEWRISYSYLKRLMFDLDCFELQVHEKNPYVTRWLNVKSKYKSSNKYAILMNFYEIVLYNQSKRKLYFESSDDEELKKKGKCIEIKHDEMHWYLWLKNGKKGKVSQYLSKKYQDRQHQLEQRRVQRLIRRRKNYYGSTNVGIMTIEEMQDFAKEHGVKIPSKVTKKQQIRDYLLKELRNKHRENLIRQHSNSNKVNDTKLIDESKLFAKQTMQKVEELRKDCNIPSSLEYLHKYPKAKSWFDLNFDLFHSKLCRLQQRCSCRSGVQLPGVCAHAGCILRLIFTVIFRGNINHLLKRSKRDESIRRNIVDLFPFSVAEKEMKQELEFMCLICRDSTKEDINCRIKCNVCCRFYHTECINTTIEDINDDPFTKTVFHCPQCRPTDTFACRNT